MEDTSDRDPTEIFDLVERLGEGCVGLLIYFLLLVLLVRFLGLPCSSSYGAVFKAINKETGKTVAIKIIPVENELSDIMREIAILKKCSSDFIVSYFGSYMKDGELWVTIVILFFSAQSRLIVGLMHRLCWSIVVLDL